MTGVQHGAKRHNERTSQPTLSELIISICLPIPFNGTYLAVPIMNIQLHADLTCYIMNTPREGIGHKANCQHFAYAEVSSRTCS